MQPNPHRSLGMLVLSPLSTSGAQYSSEPEEIPRSKHWSCQVSFYSHFNDIEAKPVHGEMKDHGAAYNIKTSPRLQKSTAWDNTTDKGIWTRQTADMT